MGTGSAFILKRLLAFAYFCMRLRAFACLCLLSLAVAGFCLLLLPFACVYLRLLALACRCCARENTLTTDPQRHQNLDIRAGGLCKHKKNSTSVR